jgi:hypothetical protein
MSVEIVKRIAMQCFAVVVDGEVAGNYCFREEDEKWVAIFSSNPTFIPVTEPIEEGLIWDGLKFNQG